MKCPCGNPHLIELKAEGLVVCPRCDKTYCPLVLADEARVRAAVAASEANR